MVYYRGFQFVVVSVLLLKLRDVEDDVIEEVDLVTDVDNFGEDGAADKTTAFASTIHTQVLGEGITSIGSHHSTVDSQAPAVYESRPPTGKCRYDDALPGEALRKNPHTIVMALKFETDGYKKRQWIFNLGQDKTGAAHWLWNNNNRVQFGTWNGKQVQTISGIVDAKTIAAVYAKGEYSVYMDGVFQQKIAVPKMDILSGELAIGSNKGYTSDDPFKGCIYGVNIYRRALSESEVADIHKEMLVLRPPEIVFGPKTGCTDGSQPVDWSACKAAADANSIRYWGGTGHSSNADPKGCIYRTPDKDIYFNKHPVGSTNRNDRRTVCVKR